jgi:hypothetical protein
VELESQLDGFKKRGLGVAALSYDSVEVLKDFSTRKHLTYTLLSDSESKIIRTYKLINEIDYPVGHAFHGIPFPGTFITDAKGIIQTKVFEPTYQERRTAASLLISRGEGANASVHEMWNNQFALRTSASNAEAAPGRRVTLILDFKMAERLHAYAPGVKGYKPLNFRLAANPLVTPHEVTYPESRPYTFEPLNETVPVFEGEFRLLQDVTVIVPARDAAPVEQIDLTGAIDYQVCSDKICYAPASMPVQWTIKMIPLDRERAPEALRKKPQP